MVYKWCVVSQCTSTTTKTPHKLFVSVPTNPKRRKLWLKLAGRDPNSIGPHSNVYMCEDHLDMEKDIRNYMKYKMGFSQKIFLTAEAVPTKFDCQQRKKKKKRKKRLRPNAGSSRETVLLNDSETNTRTQDPPECQPDNQDVQCRFCGQFSKDCVAVSGHMPYLAGHKTALALNHIRIELDFTNDSLPKTVCRHCDAKLHEICEFVKQVNIAQFSLVTVSQEVNIQTVKAEFDESKYGGVALTSTDAEYVKKTHKRKKKNDTNSKNTNKKKAKTKTETEFITDIKVEVIDGDGQDNAEYSDTETDVKPSVLKLENSVGTDVKPSVLELENSISVYQMRETSVDWCNSAKHNNVNSEINSVNSELGKIVIDRGSDNT